MKNILFSVTLIVYITTLSTVIFSFKTTNAGEINSSLTADTSSFSANSSAGWNSVSVYMNQATADTVEFEVIFIKLNGINSKNELVADSITNTAFIPVNEQQIDC